ncbi:hypothetical protein V2J09_010783 [Rumex salicifolius]
MPCMSVIDPPETGGELKSIPALSESGDLEERGQSGSGSDSSFCRFSKEPEMSSAESSSIGMNSDEDEEEGDDEIQGPLRGELKASMDSLEEALPMRRGISSFYNGKSKSFTSLADASSHPSIKSIVKPETAYSRKRRNLLAYTILSETNNHHKNTKTSHLIKTHGGGISKKPVSFSSSSSSSPSNRATLALAVAMANTSKTNNLGGREDCISHPLSLRSFCHWRSFSLVDLQQCQPVGSSNMRAPDRIS